MSMASNSFDPKHSALLSMDLQSGIVSIYTPNDEGLVTRAGALVQSARQAGMTIIHVRVGFRPGAPEIHSRNQVLGPVKASPKHQQLFAGKYGEVHPAVGLDENDLVLSKSRVNAFVGTDLELLLRARDIDTLVLFGIATSGVVLSTALHASDEDYRLFIVKDCCADVDQDLHACLIEKLLPRYGSVISSDEFLGMLGDARFELLDGNEN
jgi:nicotinamidase-related amidase